MFQTFIKPLFLDILNFALDTLFPITCIPCGKEGKFLCLECRSLLQKLDFQQCIVCQKPSPLGITHSGCKTPYAPDGLASFYDYHDKKIAKTIISGKYSFIPAIFRELGELIAEQILKRDYTLLFSLETNAEKKSLFYLVPIPLSKNRKRWRGFNQADILCQTLSQNLGLPIAHALVRKKNTKTQKDLSKDERIKNTADAFSLAPKLSKKPASLIGKNLILIDDVTTTGSTLKEAVKTLKRNGAAKVWCLTVAKD